MLRRTPSPHTGQSYNRALLGMPTIPWQRTKKEKRGKNYALHRLAEKVDRVRGRLAAPFLVALDGAQIGNLHDDAIERALV